MPKSSRRRSRKHDGYREEEEEERERSDSDEGPRRRGQEEEKRRPARVSKGSEQQEKRPSSASAKHADAGGDASGLSAEGHRKRKGREEREAFAGDDRWIGGGGGGEGDGLCYYDSKKKSRNSGGDAKGKSTGKSDEVAKRQSEKEALLEDDSAGEYHRAKEGARDHGSAKLKESSKEVALKEGGMVRGEHQHKMANDRGREHREENQNESRHDTSLKVTSRNKEVKPYDPEGDKARNKCNGTDDHQFPDELHDDGGKDRQAMPRDVNNIIDGCYEQQHRDEKFKREMSTGVEKHREGNHKDGRRKAEDRHKDNKYEDGRHREEARYRDERYEEERSRNTYRNRDSRYKEDRHKNERYKEKSRDEEKPRNERYDDNSREKYQDDIHRSHRYKDGRSWNARSSRDNTRDRSLEKQYKEEHNSDSRESRYNRNRIRDNEGNQPSAEHRSSKYMDDSKVKKRSYEENIDDGDLQPRNAKDHHRDSAKRRAEVGSFVSSADRRREHVIQEKDEKVRRDYDRKSPITSRHFIKQEESSPRGCSAASGRHKRTNDVQSVDSQIKTDAKNESSFTSKDDRSLMHDGQPVGQQVLLRNNMKHNYDNDDLLKKGKHCEVPLNRQSTENHQSTSPGTLPPPPDRFEMDSHRSFNDDNRSQIRERRSSSRSRRSGTVDNARGHGNAWNNHLSWPSPVSNGFGPVHHGPQLQGFHSAVHQFPPQPVFGLPPSMDISHSRVLYPLHEHPESFSHHAQPFPWHNPAENSWPYLPQLPSWDANRNALEEYSHSYDKPELGSNENFDLQQKTEVSFSAHDTIDSSLLMQLPCQHQSGQSKAESSDIKTVDEAIGEKTGMEAPKYKSEKKLGPSNREVDNSQFCSKYFKRLDISTSLSSPELYKKCITMVGKLDPAVSCKSTMHPCLKNNRDECQCQSKGSKHMIKSIFSGKTSIFENAMALYRSRIGYMKPKLPASSVHPETEKVTERAPENMVEKGTIAAPEDQAMPDTTMDDDVHNNDHPHDGMVLNMAVESGFVSKEDGKGDSNNGEKSPRINYGEGHVCDTEEHQVPSNNKGELHHDARSSQPACCNSEGNLADVADEQVSGVISDSAFALTSQACEDVMPGCRVNLSRIPCPPGST